MKSKKSRIPCISLCIFLSLFPGAAFAKGAVKCPDDARQKEGETSFGGDSTFFVGCIDKTGELHGPAIFWNDKGEKIIEAYFINGSQEGKWTSWHSNGNKKSEGNYRDGQFEGKWLEWHDNGVPAAEMTYNEGLIQGIVKVWNREGNLERIDEYKNGVKVESTPAPSKKQGTRQVE
ncbi:MAG: hypothetical protein OEV42_18770 [Deltaproteobacteria bacterium]|nr:hypothetical protein [Deltaproteobacteria bacterium]